MTKVKITSNISYIVRAEKARLVWGICETEDEALQVKREAEYVNAGTVYKIVKRTIIDEDII